MRKLFSTKRRIVATVASVALVAGIAGAAYAYYFTAGTGTGTGVTAYANAPTINQTGIAYNTDASLAPGTTATVNFSITVVGGATHVNNITLTGWTSNAGGCASADSTGYGSEASWFTMPAVGVNATEPTGTTAVGNTGTITFNDDGYPDQQVCQDATITFDYTSN
jgi:hypothetical protein